MIEACSPLGHGELLANANLQSIADRYQKSTPQICLRWELQHGILPLPKSVTPKRIRENINVFDFALSEVDNVSGKHKTGNLFYDSRSIFRSVSFSDISNKAMICSLCL